MRQFAKNALNAVRQIQQSAEESTQPPLEGTKPKTARVIDPSLVAGTRGYLEKVAVQINGTYENGWYDACAVMLRRFVETLIIETFIAKQIEDRIKDNNGDFISLKGLIDKANGDPDLNLSRNTKKVLRQLKKLGDLSAHNRTFVANRNTFDNLLDDLHLDMQTVVQEFVHEAGLKDMEGTRS